LSLSTPGLCVCAPASPSVARKIHLITVVNHCTETFMSSAKQSHWPSLAARLLRLQGNRPVEHHVQRHALTQFELPAASQECGRDPHPGADTRSNAGAFPTLIRHPADCGSRARPNRDPPQVLSGAAS